MHGDNVTITMSKSEARLLVRTLGATIDRDNWSVVDDEALCAIQNTIADAVDA